MRVSRRESERLAMEGVTELRDEIDEFAELLEGTRGPI
jgi:hypothetical protein